MSRVVALLVAVFLLAGFATADRTAIIFIKPQDAGPAVDIHTYVHMNWVLWPAPVHQEGMNQLLSIASGVDWEGQSGDASFQFNRGDWHSVGHESLEARGYFTARAQVVGTRKIVALQPRGGGVNAAALLLALDSSGLVSTGTVGEPIPPDSTVVFGARSWDEVRVLSLRVDRSEIIEYPVPPGGQRWSRLWLSGDWPRGAPAIEGIPGLVRASKLMCLLAAPQSASWIEPSPKWTGANRWLEFVRVTGVETLGVQGFAVLVLMALAAVFAATERKSRLLEGLLSSVLLVPAANLLGGSLAHRFGLGAWWPSFLLSLAALSGASWGLGKLAERARMSPHLALAGVSLAAVSLCDPLWSFYSPVLGHVRGEFSPVALGVWAVSAAGVCRFSQQAPQEWESILHARRPRWPQMLALAATLGFGAVFVARDWPKAFLNGEVSVAAIAICAGAGVFNRWLMGLLALSPIRASYALAWMPGDLMRDYDSRLGINVARHFLFFISAGFAGLVLTAALTALMVDKFFWRQAGRVLKKSQSHRTFAWLAGTLFAMSLLRPEMLPAAYYALFAATLVLLSDVLGQA